MLPNRQTQSPADLHTAAMPPEAQDEVCVVPVVLVPAPQHYIPIHRRTPQCVCECVCVFWWGTLMLIYSVCGGTCLPSVSGGGGGGGGD